MLKLFGNRLPGCAVRTVTVGLCRTRHAVCDRLQRGPVVPFRDSRRLHAGESQPYGSQSHVAARPRPATARRQTGWTQAGKRPAGVASSYLANQSRSTDAKALLRDPLRHSSPTSSPPRLARRRRARAGGPSPGGDSRLCGAAPVAIAPAGSFHGAFRSRGRAAADPVRRIDRGHRVRGPEREAADHVDEASATRIRKVEVAARCTAMNSTAMPRNRISDSTWSMIDLLASRVALRSRNRAAARRGSPAYRRC